MHTDLQCVKRMTDKTLHFLKHPVITGDPSIYKGEIPLYRCLSIGASL